MLTSCFGDLCISPQANLSDLPQWHLIIRPIRCTSKWKHALCEVYSDGSMVCKHPQVAESADPNQRIDRIVIKECGRVFDGQEWAIMSQHTALTDLLPFILTHVSSQPVLKISGEESAEQENLVKLFLNAIGNEKCFSEISLPYYGKETDDFLYMQLTSGRTRKLDLHGKWPSSIRYHLMAYLLSTLVPNVTISEEADLYIDQAIFDYIFEKFQMEKNSHFKVSGYLGVDPGYMKSFKLDLQRRNPEQKKGDITWVSPFNHKRTLRAVFVCDRVSIFSGKFEDY